MNRWWKDAGAEEIPQLGISRIVNFVRQQEAFINGNYTVRPFGGGFSRKHGTTHSDGMAVLKQLVLMLYRHYTVVLLLLAHCQQEHRRGNNPNEFANIRILLFWLDGGGGGCVCTE